MHANENGHRGSAILGTVLMLAAMASRVLPARDFAALWVLMALVAVFGVRPAAAPFAYVTDSRGSGQSVSVIDTASKTVVAIVPLAANAAGVAANGKHVYVAHILSPRNCLGDRCGHQQSRGHDPSREWSHWRSYSLMGHAPT
jgi:hypothetical protein